MRPWMIFLFSFFGFCLYAQPAIELVEFSSGYFQPTDIAHAGGPELYMAVRGGKIRWMDSMGIEGSPPFLDIDDRVFSNSGERGLLGIAFHPEYPDSNYFYCNYTGINGATFISRFTVTSPVQADSSSEEILLTFPQPFANHNGGGLDFDNDGNLLIATGDGGGPADPLNRAQDLTTLYGKILRIDIDSIPYRIPPDNPFVGMAGVQQEIWAYGFRNPWRIHYDELSNAIFAGDVGQGTWEEISKIDSAVADPNYGWKCFEGNHPFSADTSCASINHIPPVFEYRHLPGSGCTGSVTGGLVYRGSDMPDFYGKYFFADFCTGFIAALDINTFQVDTLIYPSGTFFSTFGEDAQGRLYIADYSGGKIYRIRQKFPKKFTFKTDLDGSQAGTPSLSTGYGIATFDSTSSELIVSGKFDELDGNVSVAHVHLAPAGVDGPVVFPLTITDYGTDSIGFFGSGILNATQASALLSNDGLYVNIHSSLHPGGEIRGQLERVNCMADFNIHAPKLIGDSFHVRDATIQGQLANNTELMVKYHDDITLIPGFEMTLGSMLETIRELCGP